MKLFRVCADGCKDVYVVCETWDEAKLGWMESAQRLSSGEPDSIQLLTDGINLVVYSDREKHIKATYPIA